MPALLAAFLALAPAGLPRAEPARVLLAATGPTAGWAEVADAEAGFVARFPAEPVERASVQGRLRLRSWDAVRGEIRFAVLCLGVEGVAELPVSTLDELGAGLAAEYGDGLWKDERLEVAGHPARDLAADAGDTHLVVRIVHAGGRIYQLVALARGTVLPGDEVQAFLDGFRPR